LHGAVDVGESHGSTAPSAHPARANTPRFRRDRLLDVDAHAGPVTVTANGVDVGGLPGCEREIDGVLEQAGAASLTKP